MKNTQQPLTAVATLSDEAKISFYKKTYSHVAGGVLAFFIAEYLLLQSTALVEFMLSMTQGWRWLIMLVAFMFMTNYAESTAMKTTDKNKQYMAYGLYVFAEALIFIPIIYIAMMYTGGMELLNQAAIVTLSLFSGLTAVVFVTKKDFSFLRFIMFCKNDT